MNAGSEPNWDGDLFRLYNKRLNSESWQDEGAGDDSRSTYQGWSDGPASDSGSDYSRALFGGPGADLFGSGYSSERPAVSDLRAESGPQSHSMPSVSPPMPPMSQSTPPGPQSTPPMSQSMPPGEHSMPSGPQSMPPGGHSMPSGPQSMPPISQSMPSVSGPIPPIPGHSQQSDEQIEEGSLVRPYARTRGRTRTDYDLAIETLVSTSERGRSQTGMATPEHRSICGLCTDARSVAEIAAHLRLPLGVVRVLVGDMAGLGLVLIHDSGMVVGDQPSMEFLERVLSGLRRL